MIKHYGGWSQSLTPQGENIKYDEMIMGKEIQIIFQDTKEWGYRFFFNDTKKFPRGKNKFQGFTEKIDIHMYRYD